MFIKKSTEKNKSFLNPELSSSSKNKYLKMFFGFSICVISILFIIGYCINFGITLRKRDNEATFKNWATNTVQKYSSLFPGYFARYWANPQKISIHIKHKDFQKLAYQRKKALEKGILMASSKDYVPAEIRYKDQIIRAKIRLKGDLVEYLQSDKWPFRVVIKGDNTLFGMKVFSIHEPAARNYIYEWVWLKAMKNENIISPRYDFIDVTLNGKHLGIYGMEEHFEKRLIENNNRREGPIIFLNEDADYSNVGKYGSADFSRRVSFSDADIDVYRPTKTLSDPLLKEQFLKAKNLLEAFINEELRTCEVFDCQILARYFALLDLFNARHAAKYGNFKIYYNPITSRLEPISYDAEYVGKRHYYGGGIYGEYWQTDHLNLPLIMFKDYEFFELYIKELLRISRPEYLDNFFASINDELNEKLDIIHSENMYFYFEKTQFYIWQKYITNALSNEFIITPYFDGIHEENGKKYLLINVVNKKTMPIQINHLQVKGEKRAYPAKGGAIIKPRNLTQGNRETRTQLVKFELPENYQWNPDDLSGLILSYSFIGKSEPGSIKVLPWSYYDKTMIKEDFIRNPEALSNHPYLVKDDVKRIIRFKPGHWDIQENITVPQGYSLLCDKGTTLNLKNNAKILTYSPVQFIGTSDEPIVIESSDGTGQGFIVIGTGFKYASQFKHVIFRQLSTPKQDGWSLTGAVTFYFSKVIMENCQFLNMQSEDALNIIQSEFYIKNSIFKGASSDALDVDFGRGKVEGTSFENSVNDAIDISGSTVGLFNITISHAGDKGISVGEKSMVSVNSFQINNSKIGVASKDSSTVDLKNGMIKKCSLGFTVFQKKPEFGPAGLSADNVEMSEVETFYLVEEGSSLKINGRDIKDTHRDIKTKLGKF